MSRSTAVATGARAEGEEEMRSKGRGDLPTGVGDFETEGEEGEEKREGLDWNWVFRSRGLYV